MNIHTNALYTNEKLISYFAKQAGELKEVLGFKQEQIEALYTQAFDDYQAGEYEKAMLAFSFLIRINHLDKRFHFGYGATLQCLGLYEDAINAYLTSSLLDLKDAQPTISIGYCLVKLKKYENAKNILLHVLDETLHDEEYELWREKAQALVNEIEHLEFHHS